MRRLNWLLSTWRSSGSYSSSLWMSELHILSLKLSSTTLQKKPMSATQYLGSHYFNHYPKLKTIGQGCSIGLLVNWNQFPAPSHSWTKPRDTWTHYLNSFPTWREQSSRFQQRTKTSKSEATVLCCEMVACFFFFFLGHNLLNKKIATLQSAKAQSKVYIF